MTEDVRPLEETDPDLAEELQLIANGRHPTVQAILGEHVIPKATTAPTPKTGRNDPCP